MVVEQTGQPCRRFKKKEGKKNRGYCPIHRTDAHDLAECKVMRGIIDKELGGRKFRHDEEVRMGPTPASWHWGTSRPITWSTSLGTPQHIPQTGNTTQWSGRCGRQCWAQACVKSGRRCPYL